MQEWNDLFNEGHTLVLLSPSHNVLSLLSLSFLLAQQHHITHTHTFSLYSLLEREDRPLVSPQSRDSTRTLPSLGGHRVIRWGLVVLFTMVGRATLDPLVLKGTAALGTPIMGVLVVDGEPGDLVTLLGVTGAGNIPLLIDRLYQHGVLGGTHVGDGEGGHVKEFLALLLGQVLQPLQTCGLLHRSGHDTWLTTRANQGLGDLVYRRKKKCVSVRQGGEEGRGGGGG